MLRNETECEIEVEGGRGRGSGSDSEHDGGEWAAQGKRASSCKYLKQRVLLPFLLASN